MRGIYVAGDTVWVDGIYFNVRGEDARQCLLVVIGVDELGRKELLAVEDGYSKQSWREVLLDLKHAAVAGDRGWRLGVLGGAGGVISHDTQATQDGECLEQAAEGIAGESQAGVTSHLDGREPGGGEFGV